MSKFGIPFVSPSLVPTGVTITLCPRTALTGSLFIVNVDVGFSTLIEVGNGLIALYPSTTTTPSLTFNNK